MKKITIILLIFSALVFTTCKKMPELKVYELNLANENVAYSQTSAEITVDYEYPTQLQYVNVTMSRSNYFDYSFVARAEVKDSLIIANFVDLQTDKNYYYKFEYSNGVNVVTSDVRSFYLDAANVTLPTVITMEVHEVQGNTAVGGGEIIDDGGYYVTARGVCWATHRNPTIFDRCTTDGMNTGNYTSTMTDLEENTVYYVRAYAINEKGTSYGTEYSFEAGAGGGGGSTITQPTVTTTGVTYITQNTAVCGGNVTSNGGGQVTARGVCWSTNENPTISNSHTTNGTGTGSFTSNLTGLTENTTYYVRAYATNEAGTSYGINRSFTTYPAAPAGAINGLFSVSATKKIYFSQGNLQYQASTNTWRFAENQYDFIGEDNTNISSTYSGWIDLFGGGTGDNPTNHSQDVNDYSTFTDWGNNAISNGGNTPNQWRTLKETEWVYVFNTRNTISGIRYAKATVNGINGMILVPDEWSSSYYSLRSTNNSEVDFSSNTISLSDWTTRLEANGAVFLPAAGSRLGTFVTVNSFGYYWSAPSGSTNNEYTMYFYNGGLSISMSLDRTNGLSVHLVRDAE